MKSAKERKIDRKAKHKALAVAKTEKSRQRRLDNKAKRDEIHAIDSDMKIVVINQRTYDEHGIEIMVENGKVKCVSTVKPETVEIFNPEIEKVEAVKVDDVNKFQKLVNKWRL